MAGNTTNINVQTLRVHWQSHSSMAAICSYWSITKDQLIRLRDVLPLPKRHDRRFRFKPKRTEQRDPTEEEIRQACQAIQARWDDFTRHQRLVQKPVSFEVKEIQTPDQLRIFVEHDLE